jgi:CheY-like chemotaxis protein
MSLALARESVTAQHSQSLEMDGHEVKAVYTAEAGPGEVDLQKPNLVLLDIGLPRINGHEVVQRIKAAHPLMSVVALSGYGSGRERCDVNSRSRSRQGQCSRLSSNLEPAWSFSSAECIPHLF